MEKARVLEVLRFIIAAVEAYDETKKKGRILLVGINPSFSKLSCIKVLRDLGYSHSLSDLVQLYWDPVRSGRKVILEKDLTGHQAEEMAILLRSAGWSVEVE